MGGSPVIQFAHFSVKEYLTSDRLAKAKGAVSRFHVSMISAHTIVAQACLGVLLHFDENITEDDLEDFPLAEYAAEQWVNHARFEDVVAKVQDGVKRLFDPGKSHLSVWDWIYNPGYRALRSKRHKSPVKASATPLHYAAFCGMHDIATFLIIEHSQDVHARRGFIREETPLHVASAGGFVELACVLLKHGADIEARDGDDTSPLELATINVHLEFIRFLLQHGADVNARNKQRLTPLFWASRWEIPSAAQVLLENGAEVNARSDYHQTPLHRAKVAEVVQVLVDHGADADAQDSLYQRTPLHLASQDARVDVVRALLENGADANARDDTNMTPAHLASSSYDSYMEEEVLSIVRLLLQYGSDIHVVDDFGETAFMRATIGKYQRVMQLLMENGAEDHRK